MNIDELLGQIVENTDHLDSANGFATIALMTGITGVVLAAAALGEGVGERWWHKALIWVGLAVSFLLVPIGASQLVSGSKPPHDITVSLQETVLDSYGVVFNLDKDSDKAIADALTMTSPVGSVLLESDPIVVEGVITTYYLVAEGAGKIGLYSSNASNVELRKHEPLK